MLLTRLTNLISSPAIALIILLFYSGTSNRITSGSYGSLNLSVDSPDEVSTLSGKNKTYNPDIITLLYEENEGLFSPPWNNSDKIVQMVSAIYNASADGLKPYDYHLSDIEKLTEKIISSDEPATEDIERMELLLTDAYSLLSRHLAAGKIDPNSVDSLWKASGRHIRHDWTFFIDSTLNTSDISVALQSLAPKRREYNNLKKALAQYRLLEERGGWEKFSTTFRKLEKGMRHPDVSLLRKRLAVTEGSIEYNPGDEDLFDQSLFDQVVLFQQRNGLDPDGVVGKSTIQTLNIPVEKRIETIEANLERWRWISDDPADRYITVNAADFELRVMEKGNEVFQTRAIVGSPDRQTPVISSRMKYIVLNPEWVVPPSILKLDVIPEAKKDTAYLARRNMKILRFDGSEVDRSSIDWKSIPEDRFPYMIRQEPGQNNPLGRIKFMFNNQYDVYIHDTPSRWLFTRYIRTFSSGCIRINSAFDLALYLLKDDPFWTSELLRAAIDTGLTRTIVLKNPIPVNILYLTAWADDDGTVYFGKDIYDRDRQLIAALKQNHPEKIQ